MATVHTENDGTITLYGETGENEILELSAHPDDDYAGGDTATVAVSGFRDGQPIPGTQADVEINLDTAEMTALGGGIEISTNGDTVMITAGECSLELEVFLDEVHEFITEGKNAGIWY